MSHWFQPLPPEHPPDLPQDHPNRRSRSPLPRRRELRHDSRQRDIRPPEPSRQHESPLLIRVGNDSHWMGQDICLRSAELCGLGGSVRRHVSRPVASKRGPVRSFCHLNWPVPTDDTASTRTIDRFQRGIRQGASTGRSCGERCGGPTSMTLATLNYLPLKKARPGQRRHSGPRCLSPDRLFDGLARLRGGSSVSSGIEHSSLSINVARLGSPVTKVSSLREFRGRSITCGPGRGNRGRGG